MNKQNTDHDETEDFYWDKIYKCQICAEILISHIYVNHQREMRSKRRSTSGGFFPLGPQLIDVTRPSNCQHTPGDLVTEITPSTTTTNSLCCRTVAAIWVRVCLSNQNCQMRVSRPEVEKLRSYQANLALRLAPSVTTQEKVTSPWNVHFTFK